MSIPFKLPELGENVESGDVVRVLVSVGDTVQPDQPVLELETDKATVEVPATVAGVVQEIHVQPGDVARVGQVILTLDPLTAEPAPPQEPAQAEPPPAVETPPSVEPEAPAAEEPLPPDMPPGVLAGRAAVPPELAPDPQRSLAPAAPNLRRLARELGLDITQIKGTGPGGRITMEDVKREARTRLTGGSAGQPAASPLPDFTAWGQTRREPMTAVRRATARHLSRAWAEIPHVTQFDQADIEELEQLRRRFAGRAEEAGGKLTITAILLKVVAAALKAFPKFNASIDMARQEIVYKEYYHIGVAVDTPRGLLVPVVRDVDRKNIFELAVELTTLAENARQGRLRPDDMQGGCFSITNLGGIGGTGFTPIVNWPEVAILGVARSRVMPVYIDGQFQPRLTLPLALSYDHRLIDGADAARFLRWIVEALENPVLMSLQGW